MHDVLYIYFLMCRQREDEATHWRRTIQFCSPKLPFDAAAAAAVEDLPEPELQ